MDALKPSFCAASLLAAASAVLVLSSTMSRGDELSDYRDDYRDTAVVPSTPLRSNYRPGRGYIVGGEDELSLVTPRRTAGTGGMSGPANPGDGSSGRGYAGSQ